MDELLRRDLAVNWHPLVSYRRQLDGEVLAVSRASGDHLILSDGRKVIDGISSWWCKLLGHQHPRLREALLHQAELSEHSIFANTTSAVVVRLSEMLCQRVSGAERVIYAADGSSVVDIAIKLSLFVHRRCGREQRQRFLRLENSYHGDSIGAMSVSDVAAYTEGFERLCFSSHCLRGLPYVSSRSDQQWGDAAQDFARSINFLEELAPTLAAIIVEPLLQGAGGMRVYSADFLARLYRWAANKGIHVIADEIMTGMGRCGSWTASSMAGVEADMVLLSKSLTSGWAPFSALLCNKEIAEAGLLDTDKPFAHSHTYMGFPLGAALAVATIDVIESEGILERVSALEIDLLRRLERVASQTRALVNIRVLGAVVAADIVDSIDETAISGLTASMLRRGLLLRPLGRTLYWMPPATVSDETLDRIEQITAETLSELMTLSA